MRLQNYKPLIIGSFLSNTSFLLCLAHGIFSLIDSNASKSISAVLINPLPSFSSSPQSTRTSPHGEIIIACPYDCLC